MTNIFSKATITLFLAPLFAIAPVTAAPMPAVSSEPEMLMGHAVNDLGGTFDIFVMETSWFTFGVFSYERATGDVYGGLVDCIYVDGDTAYFSGEVTHGDDPGGATPPVGFGIAGRVTDGGNPWSGGQDTQTHFGFLAAPIPGFCDIPGVRAWLDTAPVTEFVSGDMIVQG